MLDYMWLKLTSRRTHFKNMVPNVENGSWKMGGVLINRPRNWILTVRLMLCLGAILNSVPKDDSVDSLDFAGSTLVCIAESVEEVREQLSKDIYATSGVWDMDKVNRT